MTLPRFTYGLISLSLIVLILWLIRPIVLPLAFGAFLAALMAAAADRLRRWGLPRTGVTATCTVMLLGILASFWLVLGFAARSVASKSETYRDRVETITARAADLSQRHLDFDLLRYLERSSQEFPPSPTVIAENLGGMVTLFGGSILMIVYFAFFVHFRQEIREALIGLWRARTSDGSDPARHVDEIQSTLQKYLWLKLLISLATAAAIGLLSFLVGLDFTPVWILLAFGLNFIPSLGPIIAVVPPVGVALLQGGLLYAGVVTLSMGAIHFLSGNVIEPAVVGGRLRINFVAMLLSLFLWNQLWGFAGMILAVPIMASLKVMLDSGVGPREAAVLLGPLGKRQPSSGSESTAETPSQPSRAPSSAATG